ncbi:uncharacterized protein N7482_001279 [Penicillium canariense]|uniref:AMP-dependent synthetase/ligase domain-containing protein n=1 Tax=Penicillium canariense TaxID=189055 RepID=A0A9W9IFC0_9EURO|nr:uncharacterized protein N7482_001279 [Penicillium canariense]KAJ5175402.1 hypothetical protein N7482_001279 [Penicillium canariense]
MPVPLPELPGLPNDPLFKQLLHNAQANPNILIHDPTHGIDATAAQFLRDVVAFRGRIEAQLPRCYFTDQGRFQSLGVYIGILAPLSYDFIVSLYAITALGAAAVPLSTKVLPEEGAWLLKKCKAICLIVTPDMASLASQIVSMQQTGASSVSLTCPLISIEHPVTGKNEPNSSGDIARIDFNLTFPSTQPALLLFTSGTTGPPKGVILPRQLFFPQVAPDCDASDVAILYRAVNGLPGVLNLIDLLYVGARVELFPGGIQPGPIWERLRRGGITCLAGATRFWQVLMTYYEETLGMLPEEERAPYDEGARNLRVAWFGGGMPLPAAKRFWLGLRGEKPWTVKYGSSEQGRESFVFRFTAETATSQPAIGHPLHGVEAKLTEGDHGELLIKSPTMMTGYIDDEDRTKAAFDNDGFYRTGDLVHQDEEGTFIFDGRASADFIRFNGFRVSVYEVESHLCDLPYVSEAYVLSIPDMRYGQCVGSIVRLKAGDAGCSNIPMPPLLEKLRVDLSAILATYKLPTVLRVVGATEELPRSPEGKLARKLALHKYFLTPSSEDGQGMRSKIEVWDLAVDDMVPKRPWDWGV